MTIHPKPPASEVIAGLKSEVSKLEVQIDRLIEQKQAAEAVMERADELAMQNFESAVSKATSKLQWDVQNAEEKRQSVYDLLVKCRARVAELEAEIKSADADLTERFNGLNQYIIDMQHNVSNLVRLMSHTIRIRTAMEPNFGLKLDEWIKEDPDLAKWGIVSEQGAVTLSGDEVMDCFWQCVRIYNRDPSWIDAGYAALRLVGEMEDLTVRRIDLD